MHCINNAQIDQLTLLGIIIFLGQEMNSPSSELFPLICCAVRTFLVSSVRVTQMIKDEIAV